MFSGFRSHSVRVVNRDRKPALESLKRCRESVKTKLLEIVEDGLLLNDLRLLLKSSKMHLRVLAFCLRVFVFHQFWSGLAGSGIPFSSLLT